MALLLYSCDERTFGKDCSLLLQFDEPDKVRFLSRGMCIHLAGSLFVAEGAVSFDGLFDCDSFVVLFLPYSRSKYFRIIIRTEKHVGEKQ